MRIASALARGEVFLAECGVSEARANVEFMLAEILGVGRAGVFMNTSRKLDQRRVRRFEAWLKRRGRRAPLAYVIGTQPFLDLRILTTPDALIPRSETEELVLACERLLKSARLVSPKILEIGTGSGCIAIALARRFAGSTVLATDISARALRLARRNAFVHRVSRRIRFMRQDLFSLRRSQRPWADLFVSNPPYVPSSDLEGLSPEVKCEPRLALDGGPDGLGPIRAIVACAPKVLKAGGFIALEIESRHGPAVFELLNGAGFSDVKVKKDAQGHDRLAFGRLLAPK